VKLAPAQRRPPPASCREAVGNLIYLAWFNDVIEWIKGIRLRTAFRNCNEVSTIRVSGWNQAASLTHLLTQALLTSLPNAIRNGEIIQIGGMTEKSFHLGFFEAEPPAVAGG
jgi:hypothetical protein